MPRALPSGRRVLTAVRVAVDAIVYALAVTTVIGAASLLVGIATGGGFVRGKVLLFLVGWLVICYAIFQLWPTSPEDLETTRTGESLPKRHDVTAFQSRVQSLPPLRWMAPPPPERRLSVGGKLLLSGLLVLLVSFLMETVLGVA